MRVYLSGGLDSDWQDLAMKVQGPQYLDPRKTAEITCEMCYTPLEMGMIALADVVIVYYEEANPGLNRIVELAYAVGLGKIVVLIDDMGAPPMASVMADYLFVGPDPLGEFLKWWAEFAGEEGL